MYEILSLFIPVLAAFLTGGGIVAYFRYLETKPENAKKARQINVTAEAQLGEAWAKYAERLERRIDGMEKANDRRVKDLETHIEELERVHAQQLREKDEEIGRLKRRIKTLETELEKATGKPIGTFEDRATASEDATIGT